MTYLLACVVSKINSRNIFGTIFVISGLTLLFVKSWILEFVANSILILKPNSLLVGSWQNIPVVIPTNIYFFNWTNPQNFHNQSIKPKFDECGPYRYMQTSEKTNVVFNDNNTVTFKNMKTWYFDEEHSNGDVSDKITTVNIINLFTSHYIRYWSYFIKQAYSTYLKATSASIELTRTVNQLVSKGFEDIMIDLYNYLPFIASDVPRFDKFGFFYIRNASDEYEGVFNMADGTNGNFDALNWNYQNVSHGFSGWCAEVRGSFGEVYSRIITKDSIDLFVPDLCRFISLVFESEVIVDGVLGYKYIAGEETLDNGTLIPENNCRCAGDCLPSGMLNISSCRFGFPAYVSLPHYYKADPLYLNSVEGLKPNKTLHAIYIILEPQTALPLKVYATAQFNFLIHHIDDISLYEDVRKIYFPILWTQQELIIPDDLMFCLKLYLMLPSVMIGISTIFICIGLYLQFFIFFKCKFLFFYKQLVYKSNTAIILKPEEVPLQMCITKHKELGNNEASYILYDNLEFKQ